jgi:hypothetical protein
MKMSELILAIGEDNVEFQPLDRCIKSMDYSAKNGTSITFGTEMDITALQGTKKLGIVLWLDRGAVEDAIAKSKVPA